jgi:probable rRNA maturation factor
MLEVEVFGAATPPHSPEGSAGGDGSELAAAGPELPSDAEVRRLSLLAASSAGVHDGHLAIEFVGAERITRLNREYRGEPTPTDVLSFPLDGIEPIGAIAPGDAAPIADVRSPTRSTVESSRELGDVVICPEHAVDVREAVVHGVLHLVGMDHETDDGEMLTLQRELLASERH